jgi:hypothetical protein
MNGKTKLAIGSIMAALVGTVCFSVAALADASSNTSGDISAKEALITKVADNLGLEYDQVLGAFDAAQQELSSEALQQRLAQAVENGTITQDEADQIIAWMNAEPAAAESLGQGWLNRLTRKSGNLALSATSNLSVPPDMGNVSVMRPSGNFSDNTGKGFPSRPMGNSSDSGSANLSAPSDMGRGFPGMRPSDNSSASQPANMGNVPGGSTLSIEEYIQKAVDSGTITQAEADEITAWINAMPDAMTKIGALQHNGRMGPSDMDIYSPPF